MKAEKYIILLFVLFITPIVISGQTKDQLDSRGRIVPPGIPRGATHEGAFALALKDPNVYIGVFETIQADTKLPSGEFLLSLPNVTQAIIKSFSPLVCVKTIKGKFEEPIIWYSMLSAPIGEGSHRDRKSSFILLKGGKCILALKKRTKEEIIGRFGKEIEKFSYINENTFYDVLWYGYGALYLKLPEERVPSVKEDQRNRRYGLDGTEARKELVKVNESMVDDLEAIVKMMPSIQKSAKDPNSIAALNKMSLSLKNDLAKSILEKVTEEKEETPQRGMYMTNEK